MSEHRSVRACTKNSVDLCVCKGDEAEITKYIPAVVDIIVCSTAAAAVALL